MPSQNSPWVRQRSNFPTSAPCEIIWVRVHFGFVESDARTSAAKCVFFSKDSEKSAAGEFTILEDRHARKIVSPTLLGIPIFYDDLDNFFTGRSSVLACPGPECSGIPNFYDEKCVHPFRSKWVINVTR